MCNMWSLLFSDGNRTITVLDRNKLDKFTHDNGGLYSLFMESRTLTKKKCWHFDTSSNNY